ncbi:MAG: PIG-L family deacetylase [Chloroflexota bacterium]|nr:PIG-L family deacetylase [Chloroflexota bacterium]
MPGHRHGNHRPTVLLVFAHPADEAFGLAGTLARLQEAGVVTVLISTTRGEAGEISSERIATPLTIGAVREMELRAAMALVGVDDVRFLGYRDSGMDGTPENDDPRSFHRAPFEEVVAQCVAQIRAIRPIAVLTFGADGIYGHPDHVAVHRAMAAAIPAAADPGQPTGLGAPYAVPAVYFTAVPRERLQAMAQRTDGPFRHMSPDTIAKLGTPAGDITYAIDVSAYRELKERVIRAHATQVGEGGPMADLPREQVEALLSTEYLVRSDDLSAADGDPGDPIPGLAAGSVPAAQTVAPA